MVWIGSILLSIRSMAGSYERSYDHPCSVKRLDTFRQGDRLSSSKLGLCFDNYFVTKSVKEKFRPFRCSTVLKNSIKQKMSYLKKLK